MKRVFAIQNAITKKYWYGFYTSKHWTDNIMDAVLFDDASEMQNYVENNLEEFGHMSLIVIEIWQC